MSLGERNREEVDENDQRRSDELPGMYNEIAWS